jgi:hypothetical protein
MENRKNSKKVPFGQICDIRSNSDFPPLPTVSNTKNLNNHNQDIKENRFQKNENRFQKNEIKPNDKENRPNNQMSVKPKQIVENGLNQGTRTITFGLNCPKENESTQTVRRFGETYVKVYINDFPERIILNRYDLKGGLISESFSLRLQYPQNVPNTTNFFFFR